MTAYRITGTIEMNGVTSDPTEISLNVVQTKGMTGGIGSFSVPAALAGQDFDGSAVCAVTLEGGDRFYIVVTRFDVRSGVAICKTQGDLPFLERRRRTG